MNSRFEDLFLFCVQKFPQNTALSQLRDHWVTVSYVELEKATAHLARFLLSQGFRAGDRIAILSESQIELPVIATAIIRAGLVAVPLDIKLTAKELAQFINHSEASLIFASIAQQEKLTEVESLLAKDVPYFATEEVPLPHLKSTIPDLRHLQLPSLPPEVPAIIAYTSGTSGQPKGVVISHAGLVFQMKACQGVLGINGNEVCLSMLPMNHLFELVSDVLSGFGIGAEVCIAAQLEQTHLGRCLRHRKVTHICVVPLMLKSFMNTVYGRARAAGPMQFLYFELYLA